MDDITEQAGPNRGRNGGPEAEILVKWQIPGNVDISNAKRQLHQLLATLMIAFPDQISIIDRKQQEWSYQETVDEDVFRKDVETLATQLHPIKNKQREVIRWVSITRVRTTTTIQEWKNNDHFYSHASEAKIYVFPHPFGQDEWDVMSIGFIKGYHAVHYPRNIIQGKIQQLLQDQHTQPPPFQLIPQRISAKDNKATTRAYAVQCQKSHANQLIHQLTHGKFREPQHQVFVPFRYKNSNAELFLQCIRQQNEMYHKTWIIKIEGVTPGMMDMIQPELMRINGVFHVVPSKRNETIGEWKLLVDQSKCSYIHRILTKNWADVIANIPPDVMTQTPNTFPLPSISSQRSRDYQEEDSDIDSYGSLLSVATDTSQIITEESELDALPPTYQYPSYAAAVMESNSSTASTQLSSPTASTYPEWHKEKEALEAQIHQQSTIIEKIQADLQERISRSQDLEEKLAQALDLAHSRDVRHAEMLQKFEMLMQNATPLMNQITIREPPATPVRANPSPDSPPSKRKNTNATPHRGVYSIFKNKEPSTSNAHSASYPSQSQVSQSQTPQIEGKMDIDEDTNTPQPGAQESGKGQK